MQTSESLPYVGRFAPSPTGPLHFGSLVAAVASFLQARSRNGRWLLRIEDIDPPREQPGATESIIRALDHYGFQWDGNVVYQSASYEAHENALQSLIDQSLAYPCKCSRRDLADADRGPLGIIYPGTCRDSEDTSDAAIRLRTNDSEISFQDALQGRLAQRLESESGDFVVRRRDGLTAYHLAVVVDDEIQGITEVVRGIDLLDSTPRQIWLQRLLQYRTPGYVHVPVITREDGSKLSKLTGATGISLDFAAKTLCAALAALGQNPPSELGTASIPDVWSWASESWQIEQLAGQKAIIETA
jgi:glutamyl-Q tRNA(Asp) synthetase